MGLKPQISTLSVTTAGTRVQVSATDLFVSWARFESVGGTIYLGDSTVVSTKYMTKLTAGVGYDLKNPGDPHAVTATQFNLKNFYIDSAGNGDKCQLTYFLRLGAD